MEARTRRRDLCCMNGTKPAVQRNVREQRGSRENRISPAKLRICPAGSWLFFPTGASLLRGPGVGRASFPTAYLPWKAWNRTAEGARGSPDGRASERVGDGGALLFGKASAAAALVASAGLSSPVPTKLIAVRITSTAQSSANQRLVKMLQRR